MNKTYIEKRLDYLRGEIQAERISYGEIAELCSLKEHIQKDDVLLLEWAGVPEHTFCPRCIEDYDGENGERIAGEEVPSCCKECGVCTECEHMCDCSKAE